MVGRDSLSLPTCLPFAGDHGGAAIPVPIPNTEVKGSIAEGSASPGRARVGRRQLFYFVLRAWPSVRRASFFSKAISPSPRPLSHGRISPALGRPTPIQPFPNPDMDGINRHPTTTQPSFVSNPRTIPTQPSNIRGPPTPTASSTTTQRWLKFWYNISAFSEEDVGLKNRAGGPSEMMLI